MEIEFANISARRAASLVRACFGGKSTQISEHRYTVEAPGIGSFRIELDAQLAHPTSNTTGQITEIAETSLLGKVSEITEIIDVKAREILGNAIADFVPTEIVCPPIAWNEIGKLDKLIDNLASNGAEDTYDSPIYGFGLHLNPEVASFSPEYLLAHVQAFVVLAPWLRSHSKQDLARNLLPHANPFPIGFLDLISDPNYSPDLDTLIRDYWQHNPTRNRELDMLPLLKHCHPKLLNGLIDVALVSARPTFHYRLPDCGFRQPGWSIVTEWNQWACVEHLAFHAPLLQNGLSLVHNNASDEHLIDWAKIVLAELCPQTFATST